MENTSVEKDIRKNSLYNGLALGAVSFVLGLVAYYVIIGTSSLLVITIGSVCISVIIPIIVAVLLGLDIRKKAGGYWTLKQATTAMFIMFIIAYAVSSIARDVIFVKLVEPDMVQKTETAVVNATTAMMQKRGSSQDEIDLQVENARKRFEDQKNVSTGKAIMSIGITIVLIFVVALIFGAFLKKEPPLFDDIDTEDSAV